METCSSSFSRAAKRGVKVAVYRASFFVRGEIKHKSMRRRTLITQSRAYCSITRPGTPGLAQQNPLPWVEGPWAITIDRACVKTPHPHRHTVFYMFPACLTVACVPGLSQWAAGSLQQSKFCFICSSKICSHILTFHSTYCAKQVPLNQENLKVSSKVHLVLTANSPHTTDPVSCVVTFRHKKYLVKIRARLWLNSKVKTM